MLTVSLVSRVGLVMVVAGAITMPVNAASYGVRPEDKVQAEISFVDHTGTDIGVLGCAVIKGQCTAHQMIVDGTLISDGKTGWVGKMEGTGVDLEGSLLYFTQREELALNQYDLKYTFGSNPSLSHLSTGISQFKEGLPRNRYAGKPQNFAIDYQSCTQNPSAYDALRCCTYEAKELSSSSASYTYKCVLPIVIDG